MIDKAVQTSKDDKDLIIQELTMKLELVKMDYKRTKEEYYQFHLEFHFGASHLVCDTGITDITTDDMHIEIKNWKWWKEVIGQLLSVQEFVKKKQALCILLWRLFEEA